MDTEKGLTEGVQTTANTEDVLSILDCATSSQIDLAKHAMQASHPQWIS